MTTASRTVDLVRLPVLSVAEAIALGASLITWAEEAGPLPAQVRASLARLRDKHEDLSRVARVEESGDTARAREVSRMLDAAWRAACSWCTGWSQLPLEPELSHSGEELRRALFAGGIELTQLTYRARWVESQARLDYIEDNGLDRYFDELGGRAILDAIHQAHAWYGEVLGLTGTEVVSVRERLDAFCDQLRHYVVRVAASVHPGNDATRELAEHLLRPLASWSSPAELAEHAHDARGAGSWSRDGAAALEPGAPASRA